MSSRPDAVTTDNATTRILMSLTDPASYEGGSFTVAARRKLLVDLGAGGLSDNEVEQAAALRRELADTPAADIMRHIADDVLDGHDAQGGIRTLLANLRDPVA